MPPERLALLRQAFAATLKDPAFLAAAEKIRFNVEPMSAGEVSRIAHATTHAAPDIVAKTKAAVGMAAH